MKFQKNREMKQDLILEEKIIDERIIEENIIDEKIIDEKIIDEKIIEEKITEEEKIIDDKKNLDEKIIEEKNLEEKPNDEKNEENPQEDFEKKTIKNKAFIEECFQEVLEKHQESSIDIEVLIDNNYSFEKLDGPLRTKSRRIQSIKTLECNLDEFLLSISHKKNLKFSEKLLEFRTSAFQGFSSEILKIFNLLFKIFLPDSKEIIEENPLKREESKKTCPELLLSEEKNLKKALNSDFISFISSHKSKKFATFFHLTEEILKHFFKNQPKISQNTEYLNKLQEICPETLNFSPSAFLQIHELRTLLMKLFLQIFSFSRPFFSDLETNLTLFEIAFDYYLDQKARNKPLIDCRTSQKLLVLKNVLQEISLKFLIEDFSSELSQEYKLLLRIRAFHILTVFYSYKDFAAIHMAKSSLSFLRKTLCEFLGKDPRAFSENVDFMNLFWLNCKVLNNGFLELIEERILEAKDPFSMMEVKVRQKKLKKYLELFQERILLSFEDALDLYYKQILEFTLKPGLDDRNFLLSLKEILKALHKVLGVRILNIEEMRKIILKTIDNMKIEALMTGLIEFLKEKITVFEEDEAFKDFIELGLLILKALILLIGLNTQENLKDINSLQALAQGFSSILCYFAKKDSMKKEFLINGFNILHFLIDLLPEAPPFLHKIIFPLEFRKQFIKFLLKQAKSLSNSSEDHYFDEISQYFLCFYGINSPKRLDFPDSLEKSPEALITEISEIGYFVEFIELYHEEYFLLTPPRFKPTFQSFLMASFEFLKHHDDQWILCPNLEFLINQNLKNYLETGEKHCLFAIFELRNLKKSSNCFCEKNCFPKNDEMASFFSKGFMLIGKSFIEQSLQEFDALKFKKSNLKKAEKMFQLHVCLNPWDFQAWLLLGRLYRDLTYLYADQAIYSVIQHKIEEFKEANDKVERILMDLLLRIEEEKGEELNKLKQKIRDNIREKNEIPEKKEDIRLEKSLQEVSIDCVELQKLKDIQVESKDTLVVLNILEIMQGKFQWVKGEILWKNYIELQEKGFRKIEEIYLQEENVRGLFLRELYVRRKNLASFSKKSNLLHLKNLSFIKTSIELFLIREAEEFKDESCLIEIEVEFLISLWKILKRYTKLLKFMKILGFEKVKARFPDEISQIKINDIFDVYALVQTDCLELLQNLKEIAKILDMSDFLDIEQDIQANSDDFSLKLMLNTGELLEAGCEIETEKMLRMLGGVLKSASLEKKPPVFIRNMPLNRWINRFLEVLLSKIGKIVNKYNKKYRYYKFYVLACYYSAKIYVFLKKPEEDYQETSDKIAQILHYSALAGGPIQLTETQKYMKNFDDLFSVKTFELVEIYKKERDPVLCSLFHRDLMFLFLKLKLIKMKSSLSIEKMPDIDKLRLLNNKISKIMVKNVDGSEILNEVLILGYSITLKDLIIGIKRLLIEEKELGNQDLHLQKWLDDLIFTVVKQKTVNKFLREKQPELLRNFEEMIRIAYRYYMKKENLKKIEGSFLEENETVEEFSTKALNYFLALHNKRKNKSKIRGEEVNEAQEVNIID